FELGLVRPVEHGIDEAHRVVAARHEIGNDGFGVGLTHAGLKSSISLSACSRVMPNSTVISGLLICSRILSPAPAMHCTDSASDRLYSGGGSGFGASGASGRKAGICISYSSSSGFSRWQLVTSRS